jgi:hypoxia up-regulated 1
VPDAVITVPAWFGIAQRQALINAAALANVNVLALINTHAAAALQFGIERDFADKEQKVRQGCTGTHLVYPRVCKACSCAS